MTSGIGGAGESMNGLGEHFHCGSTGVMGWEKKILCTVFLFVKVCWELSRRQGAMDFLRWWAPFHNFLFLSDDSFL